LYKIIIILLSILSVGEVLGQSQKDFNWYNQETYHLYETQNWKELARVGADALNAGHDFYYLRLRMGIAYYEMEDYRSAQSHFNHALSFNSKDPLTLEYLYYAYLLSGRQADAQVLFQRHKETLINRKVADPNIPVKSLYLEGGMKISNVDDDNIDNIHFYHGGLEHQLSGRVNIYHGFSRLTQKITILSENGGSGQGPPQVIENVYDYSQNEYYLRGKVVLSRGLQFIPSYHFQAVNGIDDSFNNNAYHMALRKNLGNFDFYLGYGNSDINYNDQSQWTGGITFYPSGNLNFYLQSDVTYHKERSEEGESIFYEKAGFKVGQNLSLELTATFGKMRNIQEMDGFYIWNLPDIMTSRYGMNAIFPLNNHINIIGGFTIENRETIETLFTYRLFTGFISMQYNL